MHWNLASPVNRVNSQFFTDVSALSADGQYSVIYCRYRLPNPAVEAQMSQPTTLRELQDVPPHERREAVEEIVVAELRSALFMGTDEEFPLAAGFFDLGLTSLRLSEIKRSLEAVLECEIDTTVLFTRPTAGQLIDYLSRST
jgi:acyl carrier protein